MRIVFLDIDGVVATSASYALAPCVQIPQAWESPVPHWPQPELCLDPELVRRVSYMCRYAKASIVLSSSWRTEHPFETVVGWLRLRGIEDEVQILGPTPDLGAGREGVTRGHEIQAWMEANAPLVPNGPKDIVVLEDEEDIRPYRGRWIQTFFGGPHQGYTERAFSRTCRLWGL